MIWVVQQMVREKHKKEMNNERSRIVLNEEIKEERNVWRRNLIGRYDSSCMKKEDGEAKNKKEAETFALQKNEPPPRKMFN